MSKGAALVILYAHQSGKTKRAMERIKHLEEQGVRVVIARYDESKIGGISADAIIFNEYPVVHMLFDGDNWVKRLLRNSQQRNKDE